MYDVCSFFIGHLLPFKRIKSNLNDTMEIVSIAGTDRKKPSLLQDGFKQSKIFLHIKAVFSFSEFMMPVFYLDKPAFLIQFNGCRIRFTHRESHLLESVISKLLQHLFKKNRTKTLPVLVRTNIIPENIGFLWIFKITEAFTYRYRTIIPALPV